MAYDFTQLRFAQMKIVERAVRPVRAGMARKRKMREELLAHLTEIFEEEQSRLNNPDEALAEAAKRFGDPALLSSELQGALTREDRRNYFFEHWLGWRPPETAARMMLRVSFVSFCSMLFIIAIPLFVEMVFVRGVTHLDAVGLRTVAAMIFLTPVAQFLLSVCYYKTRDSLFGVFGSRKSLRNAILLATLVSLCVLLCVGGTIALMNASFQSVREFAVQLVSVSIFCGIVNLILARTIGPREIRDTIWSCMDIQTSTS